MKISNYLILCLVLSVIIFLSIFFIPGLGEIIETALLSFLSSSGN